jgi:anti-sigma regulatory factor (Ser/Thr protein kinase)
VQCEFDDRISEIVAARRFAEHVVGGEHDRLADVLVIVSELASNAVRHAHSPFSLKVDDDREQVRIEVLDHGTGWPVVRDAGSWPPTHGGGLGLHLVDALADRWGATERPDGDGKVVWVELDEAIR